MINCPIMDGKFTDVAVFTAIAEEFMQGMAVNMIFLVKNKDGNIEIHGSDNCVPMVDSEVEED